MSLDIMLKKQRWISYDAGKTLIEENETIYDCNITHNLGQMADKAGIYEALWRPHRLKNGYNIPEDDNDAEYKFESENETRAKEIIPYLKKVLKKLKNRPEYYEKFNSSNGWGMYKNFVPFVENYLNACMEYPDAIVEVDR